MIANFVVTVAVNEDWLQHVAQRRSCPTTDVLREGIALLEGRMVDAVRHHDAVLGPISIATDIDGEKFEWRA